MAEKERAEERRGIFSQHARQIAGEPPDRRDRREESLLAENTRLREALRDAIRALEEAIPSGGDFIGDLRRVLEGSEDG